MMMATIICDGLTCCTLLGWRGDEDDDGGNGMGVVLVMVVIVVVICG